MHLIVAINDKEGRPLIAVTIKRPGADHEGVAGIINAIAQHLAELDDEREAEAQAGIAT